MFQDVSFEKIEQYTLLFNKYFNSILYGILTVGFAIPLSEWFARSDNTLNPVHVGISTFASMLILYGTILDYIWKPEV